MQEINTGNITIDPLTLSHTGKKKVQLTVLRLDKIHPLVSGNKWFKLRYYLEEAIQLGKKTIVTRGGAWSNHLLATAAACRISRLGSIGIIRGEEAGNLSPTLLLAKELGMELIFTSREDYRNKQIPEQLNDGDHYFIPEGGYGELGAKGAATILDLVDKKEFTHICCAAGTGTMTAGLIRGALSINQVVSISVLKNNRALEKDTFLLTGGDQKKIHFKHDYHFGGYAKHTKELFSFMNELYSQSGIPTDFVYTGKLFFAVNDLVKNDFFAPGSTILIIHSGGLQGNASLDKGTLIF